jgi:hypothetical protein
MKSFHIQTTQMKCHGKFDKNQEGLKLTLGEGRGKLREDESKKHGACLGRAGKDTVTSRDNSVTKGQEPSGPAPGSSDARDVLSPPFQVLHGFSRNRICSQDE